MRVKVLGSAAGGGFPQWNCGCSNCARLRAGTLQGLARTQTQLAISAAPGAWFLVGASPDLRQQLTQNPEFAPREESHSSPAEGVVLPSADPDFVVGLLHLREFQPFRIYCTESVQRALTEENSLFRTLQRASPPVEWRVLPLDREVELSPSGGASKTGSLQCKALAMNGKFPDYVGGSLRGKLAENEAVVALQFRQGEKRLFFAPAVAGLSTTIKNQIEQSDVALLDGTFCTDDELVRIRGAVPTARAMGHLPLSGAGGLLDELKGVRIPRRILIHLNNTNPALDETSSANRALRDADYEIAYDGMEFEL
jgi:pyrroloquinoline quinone biosynthesis protein B